MAESTPPKSKKKKSPKELQEDLRKLAAKSDAPRPKVDVRGILLRIGAIVGGVALVLVMLAGVLHTWIPLAIAGVVVVLGAAGAVFFLRFVKKSEALGDILRSADTEEGRKEALKKLDEGFKKGDTQAVLARAQLEMQEDPRKALATLESINLDKVMTPGLADQVRAMRAMLHLTLGETAEARALVDKLELGKQQEAKSRAMFATVAGEAWARTGQAKKAIETLDLFNPEDAEYADLRLQMWRARAFAYASLQDTKGIQRALKKIAETSPQLLGMFMGKKVHPLLEREAKQLLMRSGAVPRKVVRQRM